MILLMIALLIQLQLLISGAIVKQGFGVSLSEMWMQSSSPGGKKLVPKGWLSLTGILSGEVLSWRECTEKLVPENEVGTIVRFGFVCIVMAVMFARRYEYAFGEGDMHVQPCMAKQI